MQAHFHVLDASEENLAVAWPQGFLLTTVETITLTAIVQARLWADRT
jgi:hypothetical protein